MSPLRRSLAGIAAAAALTAAVAVATGVGNAATPTGQATHKLLDLRTKEFVGDPLDLRPGQSVSWQVRLDADVPGVGDGSTSVAITGPLAELPDAVRVEVRSCDQRWNQDGCTGTERSWFGPGAAADLAEATVLGTMEVAGPHWYLVTVELPATAGNETQSLQARVDLGVRAAARGVPAQEPTPTVPTPDTELDDEPSPPAEAPGVPPTGPPTDRDNEPGPRATPPAGRLPESGFALAGLAALGLAASVTGTVLSSAARRRRGTSAEPGSPEVIP